MEIIKGGRTNYGETIGIIMLDTEFPRIPGDIGNATTFPFPVRYNIVKGITGEDVVRKPSEEILDCFIKAAKELEFYGVRAITTSCGFMSVFQKEMAEAVKVPVFTSSLIQVHMAYNIIGKKCIVGILTAEADSLTEEHFKGVGIDKIPKIVYGLEMEGEFSKTFVEGRDNYNIKKVKDELTQVAKNMLYDYPNVGAIVLECTNMAPFAKDIQNTVNLPIFDIVTLVNYIHSTLVYKEYVGLM